MTRRRRVTQLEDEIRTLESDLKQQFSELKHSILSALKFELNNLLKAKAEFIIHHRRLTHYDQSKRSSKLLAARLKQNESFTTISAIQTSSGPVTYGQGEINNTFAECRIFLAQCKKGNRLVFGTVGCRWAIAFKFS